MLHPTILLHFTSKSPCHHLMTCLFFLYQKRKWTQSFPRQLSYWRPFWCQGSMLLKPVTVYYYILSLQESRKQPLFRILEKNETSGSEQHLRGLPLSLLWTKFSPRRNKSIDHNVFPRKKLDSPYESCLRMLSATLICKNRRMSKTKWSNNKY